MEKPSDSQIPDEIKNLTYKDLFPYNSYRPEQEEIIVQLSEAVDSQKNTLLIASNGSGKTIMALAAILPIALKKEKKIIFCSRTFTQNARVIEESKEIMKVVTDRKLGITFGAVSIRGRNEMCPHKTIKRLNLPPNDAMSVCSNLRKNKQCPFFESILRDKKKLEQLIANLRLQPLDAQELMDIAEKYKYCPYFLSKLLIQQMDIIVCNYQWVFNADIRERFMESLGLALADCIVIMDESHNLPEMANELNSFQITPYGARLAQKDLEAYRSKFHLINFVKSIDALLNRVRDQVDEEVPVDIQRFLKQILSNSNLASITELKQLISDLNDYGKAIQDEKVAAGAISRDYILPVVVFFEKLLENLQNPAFFPCLTAYGTKYGKSIALELKCLDPRPITDYIFKESYATLCLSGTLHPFTFTSLLGLNNIGKSVKIMNMKPPFPKENYHVFIVEQLNTKGDNRSNNMYTMILAQMKEIIRYVPKNVGVFCASYDVLEGLWRNGLEQLVLGANKKCFRETPTNSANDNDILIGQFKDASHENGGVLLGVCGGRNSEGEDFPGDFMNAVIIVGIPFQRPIPSLEAKIKYYESLFPKQGRIFAYTSPAMQRANQACGRPIRRMDDRALIFLLDYRFQMYKEFISGWLKESFSVLPLDSEKIAAVTQAFFKGV